jgi:hypothetical protein
MGIRGEVFSGRMGTGKRTYFFNVKENRNGDLFLNMVESKKHGDTDFERHSIIVFQEDLAGFVDEFERAVRFIRSRIDVQVPVQAQKVDKPQVPVQAQKPGKVQRYRRTPPSDQPI